MLHHLVKNPCYMNSMVQGGYETTASALSFTIYNLAAHPDKAAKLMQVSPPPTQRLAPKDDNTFDQR